MHCPAEQLISLEHDPQEPPQPFEPQIFPVQFGVQGTHDSPLHIVPALQSPQEPPQPSEPHTLPIQAGTQPT